MLQGVSEDLRGIFGGSINTSGGFRNSQGAAGKVPRISEAFQGVLWAFLVAPERISGGSRGSQGALGAPRSVLRGLWCISEPHKGFQGLPGG